MKIKASKKLSKEITVCLIVKVMILIAIWFVCYSHPITKQSSVEKVAHIFGSTAT